MNSNGADPPHFTLVRDYPVPNNQRFIKVKRKIVRFQSIINLSSCLENESCYIPEDPNFPLFDAFTIELDRAKKSAILWVLQITTSRKHGGSAEGYQKIREIIAILKNELRGDPPLKKTKTAAGQAAARASTLPSRRSERRTPVPESAVGLSERMEPELEEE
ncbi:hypothetical protein JOM56_014435 [Amanita muscaria]